MNVVEAFRLEECCRILQERRGIQADPVDLIALALTDLLEKPGETLDVLPRAHQLAHATDQDEDERNALHPTFEEDRVLQRLVRQIKQSQDLPVGARPTLQALRNQRSSVSV